MPAREEVSATRVGRVEVDKSFSARLGAGLSLVVKTVHTKSPTFQVSRSSKPLARLSLSWEQGLARRASVTKPDHNLSKRLMGGRQEQMPTWPNGN